MEYHVETPATTSPLPLVPSSPSPSSPANAQLSPTTPSPNSTSPRSAFPNVPAVLVSPCAACKILRRRCVEKCVLAPYFPPTDPFKFTHAHRVFGASNIIKFLQELPEGQRADAVSSMVYEANARIRDPVYGCAGAIFQLQKQVGELQAEVAKAQAEIVNICMEMSQSRDQMMLQPQSQHTDMTYFIDENMMALLGNHFGHES